MLKLFGLASRQMYDEFRLLLEFGWAAELEPVPEQRNGNCGFDVEKCLLVFNFPPRIGRHGVHGCRATVVVVWNRRKREKKEKRRNESNSKNQKSQPNHQMRLKKMWSLKGNMDMCLLEWVRKIKKLMWFLILHYRLQEFYDQLKTHKKFIKSLINSKKIFIKFKRIPFGLAIFWYKKCRTEKNLQVKWLRGKPQNNFNVKWTGIMAT